MRRGRRKEQWVANGKYIESQVHWDRREVEDHHYSHLQEPKEEEEEERYSVVFLLVQSYHLLHKYFPHFHFQKAWSQEEKILVGE